jgi:two-component system, NtrC family, sensor histidine kinase PilS
MRPGDDVHSWFDPSLMDAGHGSPEDHQEFERLWRGFMTARVTLGLVLLLLQGTLYALGHASDIWLVMICGGYFVSALVVRVGARPRRLGRKFDLQSISVIGVDVLTFTALQFLQGGSINYTPLFALPVLLASILGSLLLAFGTAAGVTLLLLIHAVWLSLQSSVEVAPHFIQAALAGAGSFVIAFLAHLLSARLASAEQRSRRNQLAARIQQQVNDLVIESLTDGILVLDVSGTVRAANPAARNMLETDDRPLRDTPFRLDAEAGWQPLAELTQRVFSVRHTTYQADINIQHAGQGPRRMHVRTRMTSAVWGDREMLCVLFLNDLREM